MSILFFSLRGVPEDEAEDVRALLIENNIDFYETSAGSWGISTPALWLYQPEDLEKIKPVFTAYQQQRALTQREIYRELKARGEIAGFFKHNLKKPLQFIIYSGIIVLMIYVSVKLLIELGLTISLS